MPKWTEQQRAAIDIRGTNTLVSAAAGSGKTAVLVERVLQLITDEKHSIPIDRLLVATFTNAAAAEMRERIHSEIAKRLEQNPQDNALRSQLLLLGQAHITTVHAFCQHMLRNFFHLLELSADFEVGDQVQLSKMRQEAMEQTLDESYQTPHAGMDAVMRKFGGRWDDRQLKEIIAKVYDFAQSTPNPDEWLNSVCGRYQPSQQTDADSWVTQVWATHLLEFARMQFLGFADLYDDMIENAVQGEIEPYHAFLEQERSMMLEASAVAAQGSWDAMHYTMEHLVFAALPRRNKESSGESAKVVQGLRNQVKKDVLELQNVFSCTADQAAQEALHLLPEIEALCELVRTFTTNYTAKKQKNNVLDFNDLEHYMIRLLNMEDVANELKSKFDCVLVDEYQDTNGVQAAIFEAISNGQNLFMVGDVKQSIYGFRNAQPRHFLEKYHSYASDWHEDGTKIVLSQNFRSSRGILDFANYVFERIMSDEVGDCTYGEHERLRWGEVSPADWEQPVEVHVISSKEEEGTALSDQQQELDAISKEAMFVASRIVDMVEKEKPFVFDKQLGGHRPIEYRDIVILSRSVSNMASVFAEQLSLFGIPVFTQQAGSFFASVEIAVAVSLLRVVDNPLQDVPLVAVLRSPIALFSEHELAEIRAIDKRARFYHVLQQSDNPKAKAFVERLQRYQQVARYESVEVALRMMLHETGYQAFVGALPNGAERMANLDLLCQRAALFEQKGKRGLFAFINYLDAMVESGQDFSAAQPVGGNKNAVSILSMHKSKGLEFPVVFLVRCASRFRLSDLSEPVLYDLDFGIGLDCVFPQRHLKYPSVPKLAISAKKRAQTLSEEMRILYVSMTRAKEKMIIVGTVPDAPSALEKWSKTLPRPHLISGMNSFMHWVGTAVADTGVIQTHTAQDVLRLAVPEQKVPSIQPETQVPPSEEIERRLSYQYPHVAATRLPAKRSVSELTEQGTVERKLPSLSLTSHRSALSAAAKGTIIHFVLQHLDLSRTDSLERISAQIEQMVEGQLIGPSHRDVVDVDALFRFFQSDLGQRMCTSPDVRREFHFFAELPAHQLLPNIDSSAQNELVLVQGVIDCCFEENGSFVIIDFKTGRDREQYRRQLEIYALCLEQVTGKQVKETHVYPLI